MDPIYKEGLNLIKQLTLDKSNQNNWNYMSNMSKKNEMYWIQHVSGVWNYVRKISNSMQIVNFLSVGRISSFSYQVKE